MSRKRRTGKVLPWKRKGAVAAQLSLLGGCKRCNYTCYVRYAGLNLEVKLVACPLCKARANKMNVNS